MTDRPAGDHLQGETIGPYRLDAPIGSGGMGTVWRAWDERLRRHVAVKRVLRDSEVRRERLRREAQAVARLSHPAIVHVYDLLEGDGADWIVMELVSGEDLRKILDRTARLDVGQALHLGRQIAEGLAEAHAQGILHRDLKAANVMVTASGRAKILDFGLAKTLRGEGSGAADVDQSLSLPGTVLGTCYAMSPEQALGHDLDPRSDLFSLGSLLYEMLTGSAPFRAEDARSSLARVLYFQPRPLREVRPEVPSGLSSLIERLLEKEPAKRPAGAGEVARILATLATTSLESSNSSGAGGKVAASTANSILETIVERLPVAEVPAPIKPPAGEGRRDPSSGVGGERRTVTVVCCSVVSAEAAVPLELELLSASMSSIESLAQEVCRDLAGHLGAVLSHMVWIYFGYPVSHEDDAVRAVRAARELMVRAREAGLLRRGLALRFGIHTGPAVVWLRPGQADRLQLGSTFDF
ncbi:MAG TPA: protein kinase, partial [Thermoanaerobaculia bacterium]|nr:protein kinase [Thermoanaerobaculia bacterium]